MLVKLGLQDYESNQLLFNLSLPSITGTIMMALSMKTVLLRWRATPVVTESSNSTYATLAVTTPSAPLEKRQFLIQNMGKVMQVAFYIYY